MVSRDSWYQRTTLLPADHQATRSTSGMDMLWFNRNGH